MPPVDTLNNCVRRFPAPWVALLVVLGWAMLAAPAAAVVSSNADPDSIFNGVNINQLVGAEAFYSQGYWGSQAIIANVEAGHVWNGHSTLESVVDYINHPSLDATPRQYDLHATAVGHVLAGRDDLTYSLAPGVTFTIAAPDSYYYTATTTDGTTYNWAAFTGMAPGATLWSGALATSFSEVDFGSFETDALHLSYAYRGVMEEGFYQTGRKADVVNSSWGYSDPAGADELTRIIDALAYANRTTVVIAAGNHDDAMEPVGGPASGYNSIAVAALDSDTSMPVYNNVASFSNAGPNDFHNPQTGATIVGVRASVDIAAPGDNLTLAYYGGTTGSNANGTDPSNGSGDYYFYDVGGTSFAAPVVAGGAGLLVDVARDIYPGNAAATDGRLIKAVLLNSAQKTPGWTNGQVDLSGVVTTTQSLDYAVGAGRLDLNEAFLQFTAGTADLPGLLGGDVLPTGWDFGEVAAGVPNVYTIVDPLAGGSMAVTLTWFAQRDFNAATLLTSDVQLADLNLEVWRMADGLLSEMVAQSISQYNNVEHLSFDLPSDGQYAIRVVWAGELYDLPGNTPDIESYGLAWSTSPVPEPSTLALLACLAALGLALRRRF